MKEFINGKREIDIDYIIDILGEIYSAIELEKETVYLGYEIINDDQMKEYTLHKKEWTKTLDIFFNKAISLEEYEICSTITKLISELEYNN